MAGSRWRAQLAPGRKKRKQRTRPGRPRVSPAWKISSRYRDEKMIDLPTQIEVHGSDGIAGRSTCIIGNPVDRRVTHPVVQSLGPPFCGYLVPVDQVEQTTDDRIRLKCSRDGLEWSHR